MSSTDEYLSLIGFFSVVLTVLCFFCNFSLGWISGIFTDIFSWTPGITSLRNDWMSLHCSRWMSDMCCELVNNVILLQPSMDVCYFQLPVWFGIILHVFVLLSHNS